MKTRNQLFIYHFLISFCIGLSALIVVYFLWYPWPLSEAIGVTHIFLLLLLIDITIGPIITFLIYKTDTKKLKFDLSVIVLIQLSAFIYGFYAISQGRPAWLVYNVDRFELVRNNEIVEDNIEKALPQYQQPSLLKPQYVAVEFAKDTQQRNNDMFAEVLGGVSLAQRPERYVSFTQAKQQVQQRGQPLNTLEQFNDKAQVQKALAKYPQASSWVPLKANSVDMTVLLDQSGQVVKVVDLRPW
jgi:hypothetical protein